MSSEAKLLHLPNTLANWPWPRAINPHYEAVKAESDAWFRSFKAFSTKSQYAFDKCDFALLAALVYPYAPKEHLRTGCDWLNLVFIIDEYTDVEPGHVAREMVDVVIDSMNNPHKPRPADEIILGEIARQFWELAIKTASPSSQRHMIESFTAYLESVVEQARVRDTSTCLSVAEYLKNRRENVGTRPSFFPLELDMDLQDEVFYHPATMELTQYITDMIIIDNDLVSYNKEQTVGDDHYNFLTVIINELNVDLEGAVQWAADYHSEVQTKFLDGLNQLPSWGPNVDHQLKRYIHGLANWVRGNMCWSFEGGRYFGNKGLEYQKTRLIPLFPKITPYREDAYHRRENVVVPFVEALEANME
ncbi:STS14_2 [Sanghuangporus vaninii]